MIVECVANNVSDFSSDNRLRDLLMSTFGSMGKSLSLTIGKHYVVYAVESTTHDFLFYVADDDFRGARNYPFRYLEVFFKVVDSRWSSCWTESIRDSCIFRTFVEWSSESSFYERLVEGNTREIELFHKYRIFMEYEFPCPGVTYNASALDAKWLLCPICSEAWESVSEWGMVQCPKCHSTMHNPRYC